MKKRRNLGMDLLKRFYKEEEGMGTIEMVMLIAALMCIALLFRTQLTNFATDIINQVFKADLVKSPDET